MTTFGYCAVQSCGPVATARPALQTIARPGQGSAYTDGDALITGIVPKRRRINLQQLLMLLPPASNPEDTLLNARAAPSTGAAGTTSSIWPPNTDGPSPNNDESPCYLSILANTQLSLGACWLVGPTTGFEQGGLATAAGSRCTIANSAPCGASTRGQVSTDSNITTTPSPSQASTIVSDVKETTGRADSPATSRQRGAEMQTADPLPASATRGQLLSRQLAAAAAAAAAAGLPSRRGRQSSNSPVKTDTDTSNGARNNAVTTATEQRVAMVKVDTDPFFLSEGGSPSHIAAKRARPQTPPKQHHQRPHQHQLYNQQQQQRQQQQQLPPRGWVWNVVPSELSAIDRTTVSWPTTTEQNPPPSSASLRSNTSPSASQDPSASALSLLAAAAAAAASSSESAAAAPAAPRPKQSGIHSTSGWGRLSSSLPPAVAAPSVTTGAPTRSSMSARSHSVTTLNGASTTGGDEPLRSMMVNMWSSSTQTRATPAPPPRCAVVTTGAGTAPATASRSGVTPPPPPPPTSSASAMAASTTINPTPTGCRQAQSAVYVSWKPPVQSLTGPRVPQDKDAMIVEPCKDTATWRMVVQPSGQELPNTPAVESGLHLFQTGYGQQQQQQLSRRQTEGEREVVLITPHVQGPERSRSQQQSAPQSAVLKPTSDTFPERTLLTAPFAPFVSPLPPQPQPPQQQPQEWSDHKLPRRRQQEVRAAQLHTGCVASIPSRGVEQEAKSRAVDVSEGQSWPQLDIEVSAPTRQMATSTSGAPEAIKREPEPCAEPIILSASTSGQQLQLQAPARAATDVAGATAATAAVGATADASNDIATIKMTASETAPSEMPAAAVSGQPRTEASSSSVRGWLPLDANSQPALPALERLLAAAAAAAQAAAAAAAAVGEAVPQSYPHQLPSELLRVEPDGFLEPTGDLLQGDVLHTACRLIRLGRIRPSIAISLPWSEPPATSTAPHQGALRHTGHSSSSSSGNHASGAGKGHGTNGGSKLTYGSMENAAATAAAAGASQPTAPLFAVLRLLVDYAGAARALQMVEARQRAQVEARADVADDVVAATETYRALWPLMRRGRKYAEMLMTKIERTLTDNDDAPLDGDMSSPERSFTTSL